MRLATTIRILRGLTALVWFLVGLTVTLWAGTTRWLVAPEALGLAVATLAGARLALLGGSWARMERAFADDDGPRLRRLVAEHAEATRARGALRLWDLRALVLEERWAEASERIARGRFVRCGRGAFVVEELRAWCLAHLGEHDAAVAAGQRAFDGAPGEEARARGRVALGVALHRAGRHHDAVAILDGARDRPAGAFHLGEALRAIGRIDEARAAWERAAASEGTWGRRARERLAPDPAGPYRS